MLRSEPRNLALFTLGINTGYRCNEILSIKVKQVKYLKAGEILEVFQTKTQKYRRVVINKQVLECVQNYLQTVNLDDEDYLFKSRESKNAINKSYFCGMVKKWCKMANLQGNFGTHTLRKTWGYHQRKNNNVPLATLMFAFGHSTPRQTLDYLGIQEKEVEELFEYEI